MQSQESYILHILLLLSQYLPIVHHMLWTQTQTNEQNETDVLKENGTFYNVDLNSGVEHNDLVTQILFLPFWATTQQQDREMSALNKVFWILVLTLC